jgi:hypothetical protein
VSLWFPDKLRIEIAPDQVVLEHQVVELTLKGIRQRPMERHILTTDSEAGHFDGESALRALAPVLGTWTVRTCEVTVILASNFVRYALVPQCGMLSEEQEQSVVEHCFYEIYGVPAALWELRVSEAPGMPFQVATGIDKQLLDELRRLLSGNQLHLHSIQPRLMAVCNEHQAALSSDPAWLLLVEHGNLCLGLISGGGLTRLRSMRIGDHWPLELPFLLEREACLAELDQAPQDVLLWHRDGAAPAMPASESMRFQLLRDPLLPGPMASSRMLAIVEG